MLQQNKIFVAMHVVDISTMMVGALGAIPPYVHGDGAQKSEKLARHFAGLFCLPIRIKSYFK